MFDRVLNTSLIFYRRVYFRFKADITHLVEQKFLTP